MKPIYEVDYPSLVVEYKKKFVYELSDLAETSFAGQPFEVQLLAQTLIFTRWWNSYQHMAPEEPAPEILGIAIDILWDFLEGNCGIEEFSRFQKSFSASALEIMTGDDSELNEDPESEKFYERHFDRWESHSYDVFLSNLAGLMEGAATKDVHSLYWQSVEEVIYGDIGDTMIDFFESVYSNPTGGYRPSELDRRDGEVYSTPTFCRVIALLQQDMRAALEGTPLAELRARYQNEYLFSPEESAKISDYR